MSASFAAKTVEIDDPGDLLGLLPDPRATVWTRQQEGLVAWGEAMRLEVGRGEDRFERAKTVLGETFAAIDVQDPVGLPGSGPVAFASFTFDSATPGSVIVMPKVLVGRRAGTSWATLVSAPDDPALAHPEAMLETREAPVVHDKVRYAGATLPEVDWLAAVAEAVAAIRAGELEKVVLARDRRVWSRRPLDPRLLTSRLARRFETCFTFAVDGLVGATPELLVRRQGQEVTSLVLAGSAARSDDPARDAALGQALRQSTKDGNEHTLALESVRRALEGCATNVRTDPQPWLLRLANVQHLATTVRADLPRAGPGALALAGRLHPTGAVGGTPTGAALDAIARLERMDRGRYAAPVGWVDARGDGEFGIALRCAEVAGTNARLFAGAGIVAGSVPEEELEETRLKLRAMQSALEEG